jgi:DNA-binding NarL/FixJ family response regulator
MTNKQIAAELFITAGTVKAHTANIFRKLDAENRTQAIALARDLKLL